MQAFNVEENMVDVAKQQLKRSYKANLSVNERIPKVQSFTTLWDSQSVFDNYTNSPLFFSN